MALHAIRVPDIGEGVAEVELVEWRVAVGDAVVEDQPLAVVMTEKANVEIPSPVAGAVVRLGGEVGDALAVGSELAAIETSAPSRQAEEPTGVPPRAAAHARAEAQAGETRREVRALHAVGGQGTGRGTATNRTGVGVPAAAQQARAQRPGEDGSGRPLASPSVRRHARELGVDLRQVPGSGPDGRVRHEDLLAFAAAAARVRELPVIGLRRRIAQAMQESWRRIPHFSYVEEVDVTALETLRAELNARHAQTRGRLTLLPFVLRAVVRAVREHPKVNARFDDEAGVVALHSAVHAGIATHTDAGLLVPVLRDAQEHDLWSSATEIARLAALARSGKAGRDELSGSTITITSLGALGGVVSTPVINRPEVAIVGVNRIVERPAIRAGVVGACRTMNLSSSFDHRVIDGMDAARFVQSVRAFLECPATLFVD